MQPPGLIYDTNRDWDRSQKEARATFHPTDCYSRTLKKLFVGSVKYCTRWSGGPSISPQPKPRSGELPFNFWQKEWCSAGPSCSVTPTVVYSHWACHSLTMKRKELAHLLADSTGLKRRHFSFIWKQKTLQQMQRIEHNKEFEIKILF